MNSKKVVEQIQDIAQIVAREPDVSQLSASLAEYLTEMFTTSHTTVDVFQQNRLQLQTTCQNGQTTQHSQPEEAHSSQFEWVIRHKRINCDDTPDGASCVIVPVLNHQDHLLAILTCQRAPGQDKFTPTEIEQLKTVALIVASGFERAQMYVNMIQWNSSFENLLAFQAALNAPVSFDELLKRLLEHAAGFLGAGAGYVALFTDDLRRSIGYWYENTWHSLERDWFQESIPGWVHDNECPYLCNDYPNDALADDEILSRFTIKNALCVPILDGQENAIGCINLQNKRGGQEEFSWSDVAFLESLCNSTAVVLENAHLLKELEQQRAQLKALAARNIDLLEEERSRIARELHDEAGQILIGIKLGLQVLHHKIPADLPDLRERIDDLRIHVNESTQQLKSIAYTLRPPSLDKLGLDAALRQLATEFERRCCIKIDYLTVGSLNRLPPDVETSCYRIVQEALTNVARHAKAEQVWLEVECTSSMLEITIKDDGLGFVPADHNATGLGLLGMQERAITLRGTLNVQSEIGAGTCLQILIPCPDEDH